MSYHVPVMVSEVVAGLLADPSGTYLDATAGGGGHSRALLQVLGPQARLLALDRDAEAVAELEKVLGGDGRVSIYRGCFADLEDLFLRERIDSLDGALFDLGVSSRQLDAGERGFSFREDGPLDMRMDGEGEQTAADLVASAPEEELGRLIREYGEERHARRIARAIASARARQPLTSTGDLRRVIEATRPQRPAKTLARVFQALRIAVNDELGQLEKGLDAALERLGSGGRVAVLSYHSLEDRLVKVRLAELMKGCICPPRQPVCTCGQTPRFRRLLRRPQTASPREVAANPRARSAKLRIYEKV